MKKVLVDSSIWIEYFKGSGNFSELDELIGKDLICINKVILTELIPFLHERKEYELIDILQSID